MVARFLALALAGLFLLCSRYASADVEQCIENHKQAQEAEKAGRLIEARDKFRSCAAASCPEMIRDDCKLLHTQTQRRVPTIVLRSNADGVTVSIDGGPEEPLTATARELDPGTHEVRFAASDGRTTVQTVTLKANMKNVEVAGDLSGPPAALPSPTPTPAPMPSTPERSSSFRHNLGPIVMTMIGGGALLLFGGLAIGGKVKENELDDCKPRCDQEDVDMMRGRYLGADIMLGIGGASLVTALIWWLALPDPPAEASAWTLAPHPGGAGLSVSW